MTRHRLLDGVSLLAVGSAILLIFARGIFGGAPPDAPRPVHANSLALALAPSATSIVSARPSLTPTATLEPTVTATFTPEPTATPSQPLVAIIAGHRNNDSGAICESG
ncbi:MAG: hypothetical protein H0T73_09295, partial [Ardenticatenales bacterium]|nr:hypothetical protein [Ardenticatenales bacterium]